MGTIVFMLVVSVVLIGAFIGLNAYANAQDSVTPSQIAPEDDPNRFMVTISGEVARPGTYSLPNGAKLSELFTSSGGTTSNADALAYFEDITLNAKVSYYVAPLYDNGDVCSMTPISKVNINSANATDLMTLNGVSSAISQSILSWRTANGNFKYLEQIMEVSGIGNATYTKLRNYITLRDA